MSTLKCLNFIGIVLLIGCSQAPEKEVNNERHIKFAQYSKSVKDTFFIDVQLPREYFINPDKKYTTVFLIDGNFYFPMMASIFEQYEMAGLLEPAIVVGVGYKSFKEMDSLRVRDCLYPKALPSDEINAEGGGLNFYNYLTSELIPRIDSQFRTDGNDRTLLGHSFGGYFVLYSLLNQLQAKTYTFKTFVSASPALWYNNFYLKQLPEQLKRSEEELKLFISVGDMEDATWSIKPVTELSAEIQRSNVKRLEFRSRVYNHLSHMDVALLSFSQGVNEFKNKTTESK